MYGFFYQNSEYIKIINKVSSKYKKYYVDIVQKNSYNVKVDCRQSTIQNGSRQVTGVPTGLQNRVADCIRGWVRFPYASAKNNLHLYKLRLYS